MQLQLQTFTALVSNAAAAVQGAASQLLDLTVGSVLRAVLEANASMALWLQWLILQVLRTTRAATSQGSDLDSWVADFGMQRLPAVAAHGTLTFARFVPFAQAVIPAGATARTADQSQTFTVVPDTGNSAWSAGQQGYVIPAGTSSINVPAVAITVGSDGNVQPGAVTLLGSAVPGIDTVANGAPFQGGIDAEMDAALRGRFSLFLASRSRATPLAVDYAIQSVQAGLLYSIAENQLPDGSSRPGFFTVTLDDGSGMPPAALLASVAVAVGTMRPIGSQFIVRAPVVQYVAIALSITASSDHAGTAAVVAAVLTGYLDSFGIGAPLTWSRIMQVAYNADGRVQNVANLTVNGASSDIVPLPNVVLKAGSVTVN